MAYLECAKDKHYQFEALPLLVICVRTSKLAMKTFVMEGLLNFPRKAVYCICRELFGIISINVMIKRYFKAMCSAEFALLLGKGESDTCRYEAVKRAH